MFIITRRLTRAKAVGGVLLLGVFLAGLILLAGACRRETPGPPAAADAAERLAYLAGLGWETAAEPVETLRLRLPEDFSGTEYERYQALQLTQGFDLRPWAGQAVERYTYAVRNYPGRSEAVQLNLYCCEGVVIAGDVMALGEDGFQTVLAFPEEGA